MYLNFPREWYSKEKISSGHSCLGKTVLLIQRSEGNGTKNERQQQLKQSLITHEIQRQTISECLFNLYIDGLQQQRTTLGDSLRTGR